MRCLLQNACNACAETHAGLWITNVTSDVFIPAVESAHGVYKVYKSDNTRCVLWLYPCALCVCVHLSEACDKQFNHDQTICWNAHQEHMCNTYVRRCTDNVGERPGVWDLSGIGAHNVYG